ncbi:hypothetical protein C1E24_18235 [Pseudoalteromonas phenolica]|uniref:Uncharacterized protein n=1 Tax=Pseudoalteromonas phenolica TaxID=161398 RepID=A0A5R9PX84_9GAMM|nr:hypothetical protein C1E24_18235 [Pseudoalteromonas phenolica]
MEFNFKMDKKSFSEVSKTFSVGFAFGVGVVSLLLAIYSLVQDYSNSHLQTKTLFYLITGISCIYLGRRFKRFKNPS